MSFLHIPHHIYCTRSCNIQRPSAALATNNLVDIRVTASARHVSRSTLRSANNLLTASAPPTIESTLRLLDFNIKLSSRRSTSRDYVFQDPQLFQRIESVRQRSLSSLPHSYAHNTATPQRNTRYRQNRLSCNTTACSFGRASTSPWKRLPLKRPSEV